MVAPLVKASCFVRIADSIKKIVLASASSRRKELLEKIGLKFEVEPSNHVEDSSLRLKPHQLARSLSRGKALAVAANHTNAIVIAADTFIVFRRGIVGKPKTEAEAREMLARLSGKSHLVITGFTIVDTGVSKVMSKSVETKVYMRKLTSTEIDAYIKSKEPLDKPGHILFGGWVQLGIPLTVCIIADTAPGTLLYHCLLTG